MWMDSGYLGGVSVDIDSKKSDWEPPSSICSKIAFSAETLGHITIWQFYIIINE